MKIEKINKVTVLTPEEGKGIAKINNIEQILTTSPLFLGINDKVENYIEIDIPTQEEDVKENQEEEKEEVEG